MNADFILFARLVILFGSLFSIVYTCGVVWRVEKMLDVAFKLLLAAIIFFTASEALSIFNLAENSWIEMLSLIARVLFVVFFLAGILEMRRMLRKMDGELEK